MGDDYGYDSYDQEPNYGYGDEEPDYGYSAGGDDLGYEDMGYGGGGDAADDYGYGDASPDDGYGYGEEADTPAPLPPKNQDKRPKRRCSVTRFSIEAEACDKPLDYNWTPDGGAGSQQQEAEPAADEKSSAQTESTVDTNENEEDGGSMIDKIPVDKLNMPKKGMMSRIRKRLSIM